MTEVGFVTMGRAGEARDVRTIGVGMLGYAFMGRRRSRRAWSRSPARRRTRSRRPRRATASSAV
jgi:hypothetical protein